MMWILSRPGRVVAGDFHQLLEIAQQSPDPRWRLVRQPQGETAAAKARGLSDADLALLVARLTGLVPDDDALLGTLKAEQHRRGNR